MSQAPPLTLVRRLGPGALLRAGAYGGYRRVQAIDGEPHLVRDLAGSVSQPPAGRGRALLGLAHITDLQLADVQSPVRFEFFNREFMDPRLSKLVPVQRPQEALTPRAVDAMVATLNRVEVGPATGVPLSLAVTTGDAIDNAQWNELQLFLALLDGGQVRPSSGGPCYEGVQSLTWPDDIFWRPDGDGADGPDIFRSTYGFPHLPGLLEAALAEFSSAGLRLPWLACHGNHEALIQGVGVVTPAVAAALVGSGKPVRPPHDADRDRALDIFTDACESFLRGDDIPVTPDPARRAITRRDFVEAHFAAGARPDGHGFTHRNRLDGTAHYSHDAAGVRLIALDTTCLAGQAEGSLDEDQLAWLEEQLVEVHSSHRGTDGHLVRTGHDDRLVVLFSHHGLETLTNTRGARLRPDGSPVVGVPEVLALVRRFPNIVLWLNGHTHTNGVRARPDPHHPGGGFWEVTTCAVVDWPCQTRLVEIVDDGEGMMSIVCTMVDHDSPLSLDGRAAHSGADLAAVHRELAGNVPWAGFDSDLAGTPADRNVVLRMRAPFPLHSLPSA